SAPYHCSHSLFFSSTRLPPRSTIFPYTTLFRSLHDVAFLQLRRFAEQHHADFYSFQIRRDSIHVVRKRQHFAGHHPFQAMHARNAVAHTNNRAHLVDRNGLLVILNLLAQNLADFVCLDVRHCRSIASAKTCSTHWGPKTLPSNPFLFHRQPRAHLVQAGPQRTIVNRVADAHHRPAEQGGIERVLRLDFLAREPLERGGQLFFLRGGQFYRRRNF